MAVRAAGRKPPFLRACLPEMHTRPCVPNHRRPNPTCPTIRIPNHTAISSVVWCGAAFAGLTLFADAVFLIDLPLQFCLCVQPQPRCTKFCLRADRPSPSQVPPSPSHLALS